MALVLDGTNYVDLTAHGAALDIRTRPITVYAEIVTTTNDGSFRTIVVHGATGGGDSEYELYLNAGDAHAFWVSATDDYDAGSEAVDDGNLHRVALDLSDSFDLLSIVVDAVFVDSEALGGDTDTGNFSNETRIGSHPAFSNFIGQISNVAIWNVELDTEQLEDLTGGTTNPGDYPTGLLGWWPLDFDARDISGNGLDGTPVNDPDFTEEPPDGETVILAGTLPALTGSATIDASSDTQMSGTLPALTGDFSVEAEADAQLGGTLPALTGSFDVDVSADVTLAGTLPALEGSFSIAAPGTVALAGTLPALQGAFTIAANVLVNLDFVALAPVFAHGPATAPEFRQRVALAPELGHGNAGEPEFVARTAGGPVFAHGAATAPKFRERTALAPVFAHGDPGEPTT